MALTQMAEIGGPKEIKDYLRGTLKSKVDANEIAVDVTFTVGAEAANVVNVAAQLVDSDGNSVEAIHVLQVYISDAATGIGVCATAPNGGIAIGTDGVILGEDVANKIEIIQTDATGAFDIDVTESGSDVFYTAVVLPNGQIAVSDAMTFTA